MYYIKKNLCFDEIEIGLKDPCFKMNLLGIVIAHLHRSKLARNPSANEMEAFLLQQNQEFGVLCLRLG